MTRTSMGAVLACCTAFASAGCGTPGTTASTTTSTKDQAAVATTITKDPVTLKILDTGTDPAPKAEYEELIAIFERQHPNVTVKRSVEPFASLLSNVKLRLSSASAPDVTEGNPGAQVDGALVRGSLIRSLDAYAKAYHWDDIWSAKTQATNMYSSDGAEFGTGSLYGISPRGEVVGVFYNKAKLQKLGLEAPTTFAEFEAILKAAKAAGETPLMVGEADGYPGDHAFMTLADHYADATALRDWVFGRASSTVVTPQVTQAAAKLQEWAKADYFEKGFLGVKDADAQARFAKGEGVFTIGVSVLNQGLAEGLGTDLGFALLPPETAGQPVFSTGALSPGMHISTRSKVPDVAAAWLNLLASKEGAAVMLKHHDVPAVPLTPGAVDPDSSLASVLGGWSTQSKAGRLVPYLDAATSTMYDTLTAAVQDLMGDRTSPEAFVKTLQADWDKAHGGS
jgi:raffinose/stachyose/melibiose transport system substrate-binding protein